MKTRLILASTAAILSISSCNMTSNKQQQESALPEPTEQVLPKRILSDSLTHLGTYQGTLPCSDCKGVEAILTLHQDTTYDLFSHYLDKEPSDTIKTCGVYHLLENNVIEIVTPSSNKKTYYKILKDAIMLSDKEGSVNPGELSELYVLKKIK